MKTLDFTVALPALCVLLGACAPTQEKDVRLAPKMSEAEMQVVTETSTGTNYVDRKVVVYNSQVEEDDQVICKKEWVPGTRTTEIVCRTAGDEYQSREEAQQLLRSKRNSSGCANCRRGQN